MVLTLTVNMFYNFFLNSHDVKKSVAIGIANKAMKLSSSKYRQHANQNANKCVTENNFPENLINKTFKQRISKI